MNICERCEKMVAKNEEEASTEEAYGNDSHRLVCVFHRVYLAPKTLEKSQRHNLFRTRGSIKGKIVDIIIDNGNTDNLISSKVVAALKLPLEKQWVGKASKVIQSFMVCTNVYWEFICS